MKAKVTALIETVKLAHPLRMDPSLALDLYAFCEAHLGLKKNPTICRALRQFIDSELARDPLATNRFEDARARLTSKTVADLRLVTGSASGA